MPTTQIRALHVLQVKVETTEGQDATPGASDSLQLIEPGQISWGQEIQNARPDLLNQLLDEAAPVAPSAKYMEVTGKLWARGYGAAYSAGNKPEIDAILQALGFSSTGSFGAGSESYVYDSASSTLKTVTAYGFHGLETGVWVKHLLLAGRCSKVVLRFQAGKPVEVDFTVRGIYGAPTDTSPTTPTYQTAVPPNWGAATGFQWGAFSAAVARKVEVTIENTLVPRLSGNAADGLAGYLQTHRKIGFQVWFEAMRMADLNEFTQWTNATAQALTLKVPGGTGTQYNRATLIGDRATILDAPARENENGLWVARLSGILSPEGTNRCNLKFD